MSINGSKGIAGQSGSSSRTSDDAEDLTRRRGPDEAGRQVDGVAEVVAADGKHSAVAESGAYLQAGLLRPWVLDQVDGDCANSSGVEATHITSSPMNLTTRPPSAWTTSRPRR